MAFSIRGFSDGGDKRIATLAAGLFRTGTPRDFCRIAALGYMLALWRVVWTNHNTLLGKVHELERALEWPGSQGELAACLLRAGLIVEENGEYVDVLAFAEAPEYIRKRWKRKAPVSYTAASVRAEQAKAVPVEVVEPPAMLPTPIVNLFGDTDVPAGTVEVRPNASRGCVSDITKFTPGHKDLVAFWCDEWAKRYGSKYPFRPADAKHIKSILDACSGFEHAQGTLLSYLDDNDKFLKGHALGRLISNLSRYAAAKKRAGEFAGPERTRTAIDAAKVSSDIIRDDDIPF